MMVIFVKIHWAENIGLVNFTVCILQVKKKITKMKQIFLNINLVYHIPMTVCHMSKEIWNVGEHCKNPEGHNVAI